MQKFQFIKIDSILSKIHRDLRGLNLDEGDVIEWISEALGYMKLASASEEAVAFIEVKNYQAAIPNGLHYITQIARNRDWCGPADNECCVRDTVNCLPPKSKIENSGPINFEDCQGNLVCPNVEPVYFRPLLDLQYEYTDWAYSNIRSTKYTPVRLANHSFFNTLVCKEKDMEDIYCKDCLDTDEYTIVQDELRFNFKDGLIAMAYVRQMIDQDTGYPMIPDDEYAKAAITYYNAWKIKENECWNHREGSCQLAQKAEISWNSYIKKFKNKAKMPSGVDQYQNLMEQSKYILPNHNRYYGFFGKLGTAENRVFNGNNYITRNARR